MSCSTVNTGRGGGRSDAQHRTRRERLERGRQLSQNVHATSVAVATLTVALLSGCAGQGGGARSSGVGNIAVPAMTSISSSREGPFAPSSSEPVPCDSGFVADMISNFEGQRSAEQALASWLDGTETRTVEVPPSVPLDGWVVEAAEAGERSFTSGDWRATALQSARGQWLITQLGCVTPFDDAATP